MPEPPRHAPIEMAPEPAAVEPPPPPPRPKPPPPPVRVPGPPPPLVAEAKALVPGVTISVFVDSPC